MTTTTATPAETVVQEALAAILPKLPNAIPEDAANAQRRILEVLRTNPLPAAAAAKTVKSLAAPMLKLAISARQERERAAAKAERLAKGAVIKLPLSGELIDRLLKFAHSSRDPAAVPRALQRAIAMALDPPKPRPRELTAADLHRARMNSTAFARSIEQW
jgi:hypothetical protein